MTLSPSTKMKVKAQGFYYADSFWVSQHPLQGMDGTLQSRETFHEYAKAYARLSSTKAGCQEERDVTQQLQNAIMRH